MSDNTLIAIVMGGIFGVFAITIVMIGLLGIFGGG